MKKITIGRGRECDIRLEDSTDTVSRRQAIITVTPTGKMEIYDTSSNGTFVNGEKVEKPAGKPIKRGDAINFAHTVDLDWSKVKDPYKAMKVTILVVFIAAVAAVALYFALADRIFKTSEPVDTEPLLEVAAKDSLTDDSLTLQIPEETSPEPVKFKDSQDRQTKKNENVKSKKTEKVIEELENKGSLKSEPETKVIEPEKQGKIDDALKDQR